MSLISLLIALLSERYLTNKLWHFNTYYKKYSQLVLKDDATGSNIKSTIMMVLVLLLPTLVCYLLLEQLGNSFLYLVASTVILIICFGCSQTRDTYKRYLVAAFKGETTTCDLIHKEFLQNKQLPQMGFGQALVWLNYRYFIAVMLFFVIFGAPGAVFYRLLTSLNERSVTQSKTQNNTQQTTQDINSEVTQDNEPDITLETDTKSENTHVDAESNVCISSKILFVADWLPVRIIALGYMLVGHFSKAVPVWLANLFDLNMPSYEVLTSVAQKSEDFMLETEDCSAEPCSLVRLAKRTLLLCLAFISILILTGVL
ncbi:beta-lactamase regulator AmpE [Pseudocolwellia sp. HL-MZ19]|uniref:beta-lactamase regulator AmpE n=1 Tax=Pseudocolwellia sp. HL-MZ19 TaxID=3400846 RepID=UPI003CEC94CB